MRDIGNVRKITALMNELKEALCEYNSIAEVCITNLEVNKWGEMKGLVLDAPPGWDYEARTDGKALLFKQDDGVKFWNIQEMETVLAAHKEA